MKHIAAEADSSNFHWLSFGNLVVQITDCIHTGERPFPLGKKHIKWNFLWILFAFVSFIQRNYNVNFFPLLFISSEMSYLLCAAEKPHHRRSCWYTAHVWLWCNAFLNEKTFAMWKPTISRKSIIWWQKSKHFQANARKEGIKIIGLFINKLL